MTTHLQHQITMGKKTAKDKQGLGMGKALGLILGSRGELRNIQFLAMLKSNIFCSRNDPPDLQSAGSRD